MKVIINLTPDVKVSPWVKFSNTLFRKYRSVIRTMLPSEYKNQADIITHRAFEPIWGPFHQLADIGLIFEFTASDIKDGTLKSKVSFDEVKVRLDEMLHLLHTRIQKHTVILMGEPFVDYTPEVKEAFYQYLESELQVFVRKLWDQAVDTVGHIAVDFTKEAK